MVGSLGIVVTVLFDEALSCVIKLKRDVREAMPLGLALRAWRGNFLRKTLINLKSVRLVRQNVKD